MTLPKQIFEVSMVSCQLANFTIGVDQICATVAKISNRRQVGIVTSFDDCANHRAATLAIVWIGGDEGANSIICSIKYCLQALASWEIRMFAIGFCGNPYSHCAECRADCTASHSVGNDSKAITPGELDVGGIFIFLTDAFFAAQPIVEPGRQRICGSSGFMSELRHNVLVFGLAGQGLLVGVGARVEVGSGVEDGDGTGIAVLVAVKEGAAVTIKIGVTVASVATTDSSTPGARPLRLTN